MMEHEHVFELIPAMALGALDLDDRNQVEVHLKDCAICQAELHTYQRVAGALSLAIPQRTPPANLRQHILDKATLASKGAQTGDRSARQNMRKWLTRHAPAWSMVSLALVVFLAISNVWLWKKVGDLELVGQFNLVRLTGSDYAPDASGVMVVSRDGMEGTLVVDHMPELNPAYQYQLWLIRDGVRTSGGVFSVNDDGYASLVVKSEAPLLSYDTFGITIEPFGGSPGPTGDKVLGGNL